MTHLVPDCRALTSPDMTVVSALSVSRKRKREDGKSALGDSFIIKPHSSSVFDSLVKLSPAVVLPRPYIPLQWLAGHPSRLFSTSTNLPALDTPGNILIMKIEGERQLAAVEKVKSGVYTLYKLSTQLKMKDVRKTFTQIKRSRHTTESPGGGVDPMQGVLDSGWWSNLAIPDFPVEKSCVPGASIKIMMGAPEFTDYDEWGSSLLSPISVQLSPPVATVAVCERSEPFPEPTLVDILEKIGVQYYKTLYTAKTSLAYFAKSTLSRARVAMQQESITKSSLDPCSELRTYLLGMHLSFDKMDIKYRKSIPQVAIEDPVEDMTVFQPGEEEYVQQWRLATWQERLVQANDITLKRKVEQLKIRETELQIIVLLEVLALEREQEMAKGLGASAKLSQKSKSKSGSKRKEKQKLKTGAPNPKLLLDLLVDRLCIWRSIGSSGSGELDEESSDQKKVTDQEHDHLRHFCVEVVLAFYAPRLPEKCASIDKKCGGSNSRRGGMGSPGQEKAKKDQRPTKKSSLLRSISSSAATLSVRGASVDTLAALVAADARGAIRGGTLNSRSFAKREVQIDSRSGQQKVEVEEELWEAINTLKRPNRAAVASELVDESAKRLSKRSKKPARNPLAKVQVMATPKRRRAIPPTHQPMPSVSEGKSDLKSHDPFYIPQAPDSGTRSDILQAPFRRDIPTQYIDAVPSTSPFEHFQDQRPQIFRSTPSGFITPHKGQSMCNGSRSGILVPSSTSKVKKAPPQSSPQSIAQMGASRFVSQNFLDPIDDTSPLGGVRLFDIDTVSGTPSKTLVISSTSRMDIEGKKGSIYDSLGWGDDYDL